MTDQPQQPEPQFEPTPPPAEGQPADLINRFLARLVDGILLGVVLSVLIVPLVIGAMFTGATFGLWSGFSLAAFVSGLVGALIMIGYFAFMESRSGQTVGKMLLGLKTLGPDGQPPTMEQALRRNAWMLLGVVPAIGGLAQLAAAIYIAVTINNTGTGWHDEFAGGTRVVRIR